MTAPEGPDDDRRWMDAALNLGERSLGLAAPNPAVGAILVKDGAVVGRGVTAPGGRPHAERIAIARGRRGGAGRDALRDARALLAFRRDAALRGRDRRGGDCARGVARWKTRTRAWRGRAMPGCGPRGSMVTVGPGSAQARRDHRGHIMRVTAGRPCVTLKLAETADGYASGGPHDPRLQDHRTDRQSSRSRSCARPTRRS